MNNVSIIGRMTADAQIRKTPNDKTVTSFTVAVDRYSNGEKKADFINFIAWGNTAENIAKYFKKGNTIGLTGSIQTRQYQDKDTGKNRTAFEVLVDRFYFTGSANGTNTQPQIDAQGFETVADDSGDLPF